MSTTFQVPMLPSTAYAAYKKLVSADDKTIESEATKRGEILIYTSLLLAAGGAAYVGYKAAGR